jgi:transcriptional regulator with XRE-family HTH domain
VSTHFALALGTIRRQKGFTLAALGDRSGIHAATLGRYERGLRPSIEAIGRLSHALDVPAATLADAVFTDLQLARDSQ